MKRRLFILLAIVVAVAQAALPSLSGTNGEPMHKGNSVRAWVDQACTSYDAEARRAIREIGKPAVPFLIGKLGTQETDSIRDYATMCLFELGPSAAPAVSSFVRIAAGNGVNRDGALLALGKIGPQAAAALPFLHEQLATNSNVRFRMQAAAAVLRIGGNTNQAKKVLLDELSSQATTISQGRPWSTSFFWDLSKAGPAASDALPLLHTMLAAATNDEARIWIAIPIWYIGRETNTVLRVFTNALISPNTSVSTAAQATFWNLGEAGEQAVPFLISVQQDANQPLHAREHAGLLLMQLRDLRTNSYPTLE